MQVYILTTMVSGRTAIWSVYSDRTKAEEAAKVKVEDFLNSRYEKDYFRSDEHLVFQQFMIKGKIVVSVSVSKHEVK